MYFIIFAAIIILFILIVIVVVRIDDRRFIESQQKQAGRRGELFARQAIQEILRDNGINIWIEGYVFFVQGNSPVQSDYVVDTQADIDRIIHDGSNRNISETVINNISGILCGKQKSNC